MACTSIIALPVSCGADNVMGGVEKLFMLAYSDLNGDPTYATNGTVSAITLDASKKFAEVGLLLRSSDLKQSGTFNPSNGSNFYTQTMSVVIKDFTPENQAFIDSLLGQPVVAILKLRSGKYIAAGLNGHFRMTGDEGGTGMAEGDLNGSTLTFSGTSYKRAPIVDPTIISGLIA